MKWIWSTAIVVVAVSSAVSAQSGKVMGTSAMGGTMKTTYTGCVESVNHGASYLLTHLGDDRMGATHDDAMMKKDDAMMKKDDAMMKKDEPMAMEGTRMDTMTPRAVVLAGSSDIRKHVGQKVSVTGSLSKESANSMPTDRETLTVSSLKVVAKSCS